MFIAIVFPPKGKALFVTSANHPGVVELEETILGKPVTFNFFQGEFVCDGERARDFEHLERQVIARQAERAAVLAEREATKARAAEPLPVSVVRYNQPSKRNPDPSGIRSNYLLTGWHKTHKTPLLRVEHLGISPGFEASALAHAAILRRLTAEEWDAYDNLLADYYAAWWAYQNEGRLPISVHTAYQSTGEIIASTEYHDDSLGRFPVSVEGRRLIAKVPGGLVAADDIYKLQYLVEEAVHPDQGAEAMAVNEEDGTVRGIIFDCRNLRSSTRVVFDSTATKLGDLLHQRRSSLERLDSWIDAYRLPR